MTKLDKEKLRKELIEVYENFDKGNYSKEMKHKAETKLEIEIDHNRPEVRIFFSSSFLL